MDLMKLAISLALCFLAGFIGSIFTTPSIATWYADLIKPSFNPPNWIFAPVWTILYVLMAISFYLVWQKGTKEKIVQTSLFSFIFQLMLNMLWSIVFFGMHSPLWGFLVIILLWIAILTTIVCFYKVSKLASYVLIPYILWVSFAAVLNYSVFILNR